MKDSLFTYLTIIFLAVAMLASVLKYKEYPDAVEAELTNIYDMPERKVIGYGYHGKVYDKPAPLVKYAKYNYTVDNIVYTYTMSIPISLNFKDSIILRYKDDPTDVIVDKRH